MQGTIFLNALLIALTIFLIYRNNRPLDLFARYPLEAIAETRRGTKVPIPFHAYSADAVAVYGTSTYSVAKKLMEGQDYIPVQTKEGEALAVIWLMTYNNTCIGPFRDIVVLWLAARTPLTVDITNEFTPAVLLATHPDIVSYMWKLWVTHDDQVANAYGRDVLGLDEQQMKVDRWFDYARINNANWTYREYHAKAGPSDSTLLDFKWEKEASPFMQAAYVPSLIKAWGLSNIIGNYNKMFSTEFIYRIAGPKGILPHSQSINPRTQLFAQPSIDIGVTYWNRKFVLSFGTSELASLGFKPQLIQHDPWIQFVHLPPYNVGSNFSRYSK